MKKKIFLSVLLAGVISVSTACSGGENMFALSHYDGSDYSQGFDSDLLYRNTSEWLGGDTGIIYVSKEEDPEYGGYFYQYQGDCASVQNPGVGTDEETGRVPSNSGDADYHSHIMISRSKNMYDWETCGIVDNGMGLKLSMDSWTLMSIWAPETIRDPESGKYYMYFGSRYRSDYPGDIYTDTPIAESTRSQYWAAAVAVSDTPVGPFMVVTSENTYNGGLNPNGDVLTETVPTINFNILGVNTDFHTYFADLHPFIDVNGDLYLYFNSYGNGASVWGMKMKDFATPDYSTITCLMSCANAKSGSIAPDGDDNIIYNPVRSVYRGDPSKNAEIYYGAGINEDYPNDPEYPRWDYNSQYHYESWEDGTKNDKGTPLFICYRGPNTGTVREGSQVIYNTDANGKTTYYLTFTFGGVREPGYEVHFATASTPLGSDGEFTLPKGYEFGTILGVDVNNNFMSSLGHVEFINVEDEWWIGHWEWAQPFGSQDIGRLYALTQMTWIEDASVDYLVPVANGPTTSLQAAPAIYTGYKNIASEATITVKNQVGDTAKYLTDGYVTTKNLYADREFTAKKKTEITLEFKEPKSIRGILIYNSYNYENAFESIDLIKFELAETPSWHKGTQTTCFINNLQFNKNNYEPTEYFIQAGNAAIATFSEIKVKRITISISKHLGNATNLCVSEISVLGK